MDSPCHGPILLVGDGDFSFTLALLRKLTLKGSQVTTSNLETHESIQQHKQASDNMAAVSENGAVVLLEIDARDLHSHPSINQRQYDRIIFNFPLADRHNIKKNRALLSDFFASCSHILSADGHVMVTLCKGQGGTPADQPLRSWHDSWQIVAMATNSGFLLTNILPFDAQAYPGYHSVGFRFQDKSFNSQGALTHIFEKVSTVSVEETCPRGTVCKGPEVFSCSHYVAEKAKRNLLQESANPVHLMGKILTDTFTNHLKAKTQPVNVLDTIVKGRQSVISVQVGQGKARGSRTSETFNSSNVDTEEPMKGSLSSRNVSDDMGHDTPDNSGNSKEKKNEANRQIVMKEDKKVALIHGFVSSEENQEEKAKYSCEKHELDPEDIPSLKYSTLLPVNTESVYVVIKNSNCTLEQGSEVRVSGAEGLEENKVVNPHGDGTDLLDDEGMSHRVHCGVGDVEDNGSEIPSLPQCLDTQTVNVDLSDRVYHLRSSLLENLPHICSTVLSTQNHLEMTDDIKCSVMYGQCFYPCDISPSSLPVCHQLVLAHRLGSRVLPAQESSLCSVGGINDWSSSDGAIIDTDLNWSTGASIGCETMDTTPAAVTQEDVDVLSCSREYSKVSDCQSVISSIICSLNKSGLISGYSLHVSDVEGTLQMQHSGTIGNIHFISLVNQPQAKLSPDQNGHAQIIGLACCVKFRGQNICLCLFNLDIMACTLFRISNPRLLWSTNRKCTEQFKTSSIPIIFKPFCLYPMKFVHDLSFWEKEPNQGVDTDELYDAIRSVAGDIVVSVILIDNYVNPTTGLHSLCYRLHFQSHDQALPYLSSWKLQSMIRMEVVRRLGVTLR